MWILFCRGGYKHRPLRIGGRFQAIPHNSKCRYGERGAADAKPKAQIILCAAKVSAASGGCSEPKQGQRSQSARGFCPRSTMRVPQPDIIEHFGNADAVPHTEPQRGASERNRRLRRLLARRSAGAVLKPLGGNCAVLPSTFLLFLRAMGARQGQLRIPHFLCGLLHVLVFAAALQRGYAGTAEL